MTRDHMLGLAAHDLGDDRLAAVLHNEAIHRELERLIDSAPAGRSAALTAFETGEHTISGQVISAETAARLRRAVGVPDSFPIKRGPFMTA